jgi:protein disulfide-isomerase
MMRLRKILIAFFTLSVMFSGKLNAQDHKNGLTWYTDINQVYEISNKTKKPIFAFFTGSDWCGWCHRLEHNVFDKPGFKEWAKANVVLLELDFPRSKQLPEALVKQNSGLQQFFNVQGYPTVWMFYMNNDTASHKMNITALGSLQYPQSIPGREEVTFLDNANLVLKKKNQK